MSTTRQIPTDMPPINDTWLSGKPYYCALCGLGYGEFMACEEVDCRLETEAKAQARLRAAAKDGETR